MPRRLMRLTAAMMAMVMAGPVTAQVTTNGLTGQPACSGGYTHTNVAVFDSSNNQINFTNTSVNFKLSSLTTWTNLRGLLAIGNSPVSSITVTGKIRNTRTNTDVQTVNFGTVTSTQNPSFADNNVTLTEKTPYVLILYTDLAGHTESNPMGVQCIMTGGSYTINTVSHAGYVTNGCFSISPRTPQDVRNCLCGRPATGAANALWQGSLAWDYSSYRTGWGCR